MTLEGSAYVDFASVPFPGEVTGPSSESMWAGITKGRNDMSIFCCL